MTAHPDGQPQRTPGRLVPWGRVREQRRSHLFLGGNERAARLAQDPEMEALEAWLNRSALDLRVVSAARAEAGVRVRAELRSLLVGHQFPANEADVRTAGVRMRLLAAGGEELGRLDPERDPSLQLLSERFQRKGLHTSALTPDEVRAFDVIVPVRPGGAPVARVRVELLMGFAETPIATAELGL